MANPIDAIRSALFNRVEQFKSTLGVGYKKNHFDVYFFFNSILSQRYNLTSSVAGKSYLKKLLNKAKFFAEIMLYLAGSISYFSFDGNNATGKDLKGLLKLIFTLPLLWQTTVKAVNLPTNTLKISESVYKNKKVAIDSEKGPLTVTFYNDDKGVNYNMWKMYIAKINNGQISAYPDTYCFDIAVSEKSPFTNLPGYVTTFYNCFPTKVSELVLDSTDKDIFSFTVDMEYYDFKSEYSSELLL